MLNLDDPRWKNFEGGYRHPYDASVLLKTLEKITKESEAQTVLDELWEELHHQGDVGLASYVSVPHLIRIAKERQFIGTNIIALVTVIEIQRHKNNPPLPKECESSYLISIRELTDLVLVGIKDSWDLETTAWMLSALAVSKGQPALSDAISKMDTEDMIDEFLENN